jgi:uncharacterized protein (TIGR03435 family)
MLQELLAERFRLKFHREMREMPVDRLVIGKDLKLIIDRAKNGAGVRGRVAGRIGRRARVGVWGIIDRPCSARSTRYF